MNEASEQKLRQSISAFIPISDDIMLTPTKLSPNIVNTREKLRCSATKAKEIFEDLKSTKLDLNNHPSEDQQTDMEIDPIIDPPTEKNPSIIKEASDNRRIIKPCLFWPMPLDHHKHPNHHPRSNSPYTTNLQLPDLTRYDSTGRHLQHFQYYWEQIVPL
ncbi:uncharacterized protein BX663DRAFT_555730 [Cokeromyces recurvatus]|uniref:uncharacterized protein n=1 Tax=Cokeromyces recurvatus TaxID=90255 RepID=UPI00221F8EFC|nr:uncharacterized protein BX663DRAFT_555730 [Cokeromyces recurvatus]KAI7898515.1 hypothetical protein BX663DRAFT_555730 [Cokeromyces recurvatus]